MRVHVVKYIDRNEKKKEVVKLVRLIAMNRLISIEIYIRP